MHIIGFIIVVSAVFGLYMGLNGARAAVEVEGRSVQDARTSLWVGWLVFGVLALTILGLIYAALSGLYFLVTLGA